MRAESERFVRQIGLWLRNHIFVLTTLVAALIAAVPVVLELPGLPDAAAYSLAAVFGVLLVISVSLAVLGDDEKKRIAAADAVKGRRLAIDPLLQAGSTEQLPRLSELRDVDLGATQTRYTTDDRAPYVPRQGADETLRQLLTEPGPPYPFVIVWGTTKAGKSRTLAEALRGVFVDDPAVILPRDEHALAELSRLQVQDFMDRRPALVVLDDLDPSGLESLTTEVLRTVRGWATIAATMTAHRRAEVLQTGSEAGIARAALAATSGQLELSSAPPTGAEKVEAERLYPQEQFDGSIAETLVGAAELIARYRASQDSAPAGCAVMRAAIDARRGGLARPVTDPELRRLFPFYLRAVRIDLQPTDDEFTNGIQWATRPVASQVALLRQVPNGVSPAWMVFDHAVTADEGGGGGPPRRFPSTTWAELTDVLPVDDTYGVGTAAFVRGESAAAITAFNKAATSSDINVAAGSGLSLGLLRQQNGDVTGARAAYQKVMESGHPLVAPAGAWGLGNLLKNNGDAEGAAAAFQRAIDSGHPDYAPPAALGLGQVREKKGDTEGAKAAYQLAVDSGHPVQAPVAARLLAMLLERLGKWEGARTNFQYVIDSGAHDAPKVALYLGNMLREHGDVEGAAAAYQRAIDSGDPEDAPFAANRLGSLLEEQGDVAGAAENYQLAIDSGISHAPVLTAYLGEMLKDNGDVAGAAAAFTRALEYDDPQVKQRALIDLGSLLEENGDLPGAANAYKMALDLGHCDDNS
jgi:tetratricopeptide (TPR) repeat protein